MLPGQPFTLQQTAQLFAGSLTVLYLPDFNPLLPLQSSKYSALTRFSKKRLNLISSKALSHPAPYPGIPFFCGYPLFSKQKDDLHHLFL